MKLYNVFIRCATNGVKGVITATSYTHASTKAQQLYGRHAWVEPKQTPIPA
jgi:hypothetical protein